MDLCRATPPGLVPPYFRRDVLVLLENELIPPEAPSADLSVTQSAQPSPGIAGQSLFYTFTVTNNGPNSATLVRLLHESATKMTFVAATTAQGACTNGPNSVNCDLGSIESGSSIDVKLVVTPRSAGTFADSVRVSSAESDPDFSNNQSMGSTDVYFGSGPTRVTKVKLSTNDMAYDPLTRLIYATVPESVGETVGHLVAMDPLDAQVVAKIDIGTAPGKLALSDDGKVLYVSLHGNAIRRVDVTTFVAGLTFSLGNGFPTVAYIQDMEVQPGHPDVVVVSGPMGVVVFSNGVALPKVTQPYTASVIAFRPSSSIVYGFDIDTSGQGFYRIIVNGQGASIDSVTYNLITDSHIDLLYDGGRIFTTSGKIIDPEKPGLVATLPRPDIDYFHTLPLVAPDTNVGRAFMLFRETGQVMSMFIYDLETFQIQGAVSVPVSVGPVSSFIRWGADGLAFSANDETFLIRTSARYAPWMGDLDGDGTLAAGDISQALRFYLGLAQPTGAQLKAGDVLPNPTVDGRNIGDGVIGAEDVNWIIRRWLNLL